MRAMMKNNYTLMIITIIITQPLISNFDYVETTRTYWTPWTTQHSQQWEECELSDSTVSHFRRNEYFEDITTLTQRDSHWNTLCNLLNNHCGASFIFPHLGFAIFDKINNSLIGTIRFKPSSKAGYLSFGYGLRQDVRHQKLGAEIIEKIINLTHQSIGLPIATLKKEVSKNNFMAQWHKNGNKKEINFDNLLELFDKHPTSLCGIIGSVDMRNQGSLSILIRNKMQPTEIQCSKYYLENGSHLFAVDFSCTYPISQEYTTPTLEALITNILSRDAIRIEDAENRLKEIFNIPDDWGYLALSRAEKAELRLKATIESTAFFSELNAIKKISSHYHLPPYCFVK
jgi:hypothetical protein